MQIGICLDMNIKPGRVMDVQKLKNDPGFCHLLETAARGWLEKMM